MPTDTESTTTSCATPPEDREAARDEFHVRCERSANWVVRRIVEARAYRRRVQEWAERETRRAARRERFLLLRFGGELEDWTRQQIAASKGRLRSVHLPAGIVGFRAERPRLLVADESALTGWCRVHLPSAVQTVERVLKRPLNEHVHATGELPEGTDLSRGGEKFYVR